jgi:hypothetical protein
MTACYARHAVGLRAAALTTPVGRTHLARALGEVLIEFGVSSPLELLHLDLNLRHYDPKRATAWLRGTIPRQPGQVCQLDLDLRTWPRLTQALIADAPKFAVILTDPGDDLS